MKIENMGKVGFTLILAGIAGVLWGWDHNDGDIAMMSIVGVVLGLALFIVSVHINRYLDRLVEDNMDNEHSSED